jgi:Protein of unknown function (DUF3995)
MSWLVPYLLAAALLALALLHAYWARGGVWPAADEAELAQWAIGEIHRTRMPPPRAIALVAASLFLAAVDAVALGLPLDGLVDRLVVWSGVGLTGVFALRGIAGYTPFWRAAHPGPAFTWMDKRVYSPLCILLAEGFFTLVSDRL